MDLDIVHLIDWLPILWLLYFVLVPSSHIPAGDTVTLLSVENIVLNIALWGDFCLHFEMKIRHVFLPSVINAYIYQIQRQIL